MVDVSPMVAGAVCETGCEELIWLLVVAGLVVFAAWLADAVAFAWAASLAVNRRHPTVPAAAVVVIGVVVGIAVAGLSAAVALSDHGLVVLALPPIAAGWLVYELRARRRLRVPAVDR